MKQLILLALCACLTWAAPDFSAMSNQELIALMGYVKSENRAAFEKELERRKPTFSPKEKNAYEANRSHKGST